jgi:hypothetical protein
MQIITKTGKKIEAQPGCMPVSQGKMVQLLKIEDGQPSTVDIVEAANEHQARQIGMVLLQCLMTGKAIVNIQDLMDHLPPLN